MFDYIREMIQENPVMLFIKGTKEKPFCGFSKAVVAILQDLKVQFETMDVLMDPQLRNDLKEFSDWPTFPQLYICGEFIGGCDIVTEMYHAGELQEMIQKLAQDQKIKLTS